MDRTKRVLKIAWYSLAIITTSLVCVECLAFAYYFLRPVLSGYDRVDSFIKAQVSAMPREGYPNPADESWFGPYWKEFNDSTFGSSEWTSYSNWHRRPFKGKYINVDENGRRLTWSEGQRITEGPIQIALFGGATMWGTGARDEFTIPSHVSKVLAQTYPRQFSVVNYGQDAYVSTQEVVAFLREIQMNNIPDIVVFYDGFNDASAAVHSGVAGIPLNEDDRMREFNILHPSRAGDFYLEALRRTNTFELIEGLRNRLWFRTAPDSFEEEKNEEDLALDVVRVYFRNVEFVRAIARQFGIVARFFWQPSVYTRVHPTEPERSIIRATAHAGHIYGLVHEAMKQVEQTDHPASFRDLSTALDEYPGTAFIGTSHATEIANELVAREIVADLQDTLRQVEARARVAQK
jgi:hypothetical protein